MPEHAISPSDPNNDFPFWYRITDPRNLSNESKYRVKYMRLYRIHEPNGEINELTYGEIERTYHVNNDTVRIAIHTGKMRVRGEVYRVEVIDLVQQKKEAPHV